MSYPTTPRLLNLSACLLGLLWTTAVAAQSAGMLTDIEKRDQAATMVSWVSPEGGAGLAARIRLITFNDFHGRIEARQVVNGGPGEPGRPVGGAAVMKAWIDSLVAQSPKDAVIIAAGDQIGGSPPVSARAMRWR